MAASARPRESGRRHFSIENTGSGPLTFDYRPMLAVGLPKPPLAENFDFEVGRLPIQMSSDVSGSAMLLDGEVIVGNGSVESFNVLLRRARLRGRSTSNALAATFDTFDLLWHEGPRPDTAPAREAPLAVARDRDRERTVRRLARVRGSRFWKRMSRSSRRSRA